MSRTSIVLLAVALGLLGFIVFFERGSLSTTELEVRKGRVLADFVRDRVTRVELQRHGVTTVLVHVAPNPDDPLDLGGWEVQAPYKAKADSTEVDTLLGALEWAEARRSLGAASPEDIQRFGLDAPRYRVRYRAGREDGGFSIGAPAPDGGGAYLRLRGSDAVYVVGPDVLDALNHEPNDYHSKSLHEGLTSLTLQRLTLRSADKPERSIVKREGYFWLDAPLPALAGTPQLKAVVDSLDALRATRYIGERAQAQYELASPGLAVTLDSLIYDSAHKGQRTTERFRVQVGATCGAHAEESYIQLGDGAVYCASKSQLATLDKSAEQLRETRLLPLDDAEIAGVSLRHADRELSLETSDQVTKFRLTKGDKELQHGVADPEALKDWYAALRGLQVEGFAPVPKDAERTQRAAPQRSELQATFKRTSKDDAPYVLRLRIDAEGSTATRMTEPALLQLPASAAALLEPMLARYRNKRLLDEDASQLSAISVARAAGEVERIEKVGGAYRVVAPVHAPAEPNILDELSRLFSKLEALRFAADTARPEHGLASPYRTLSVQYGPHDKPRTHRLVIGSKSGDQGRYAQLDEDPSVFVVSNALASKLDEPLVSRAALQLPVERLRELALTSGDKQVVKIERSADGYSIAGQPLAGAAADRARRLVEALAQLKAEHVHAYADQAPTLRPRLQARVQLVDPDAQLSYAFYEDQPAAKQVLVRRSDLPLTWVVPAEALQHLVDALGSLNGTPVR